MNVNLSAHERIGNMIAASCRALDEERFADFLAVCSESFRYRVRVYSPEIRKEMIWLDLPLDELRGLFGNVQRHFRTLDRLQRNVGLFHAVQETDHEWGVDCAFSAYATDRDGASRLFAVGRYFDRISVGPDALRLLARDVVLQTRDLGVGLHTPL